MHLLIHDGLKAIPENAKIAKDAKETVQECVSEFISFITSEASEKCHQERRKTINGEDIIFAMQTLGFDAYIEPLQVYLKRYREDARNNEPNNKKGGASEAAPGDYDEYPEDVMNL